MGPEKRMVARKAFPKGGGGWAWGTAFTSAFGLASQQSVAGKALNVSANLLPSEQGCRRQAQAQG